MPELNRQINKFKAHAFITYRQDLVRKKKSDAETLRLDYYKLPLKAFKTLYNTGKKST